MEAYKVQRSEEWYKFRKDKIGASDAPIILGISPWMTSRELWEERKGIRAPRQINEAMNRGIQQEGVALEYVKEVTGVEFRPDVKIFRDNPKIIASLDGISEREDAICEIKCSQRYYNMAAQGKVFPDTYCQVQHQMLVTGLQMAWLCAFDGIKGKILEINRDKDFIEEMLEAEINFLKCLENDLPPPDDSTKKIEVSPFQQETLFNWVEVSKQLKALEKQEKELRENLLSMASDEKVMLLYEGHPMVKMTKITRDGTVDWRAFCKDRGLDLSASEEYRKKPVSYYQLKAM